MASLTSLGLCHLDEASKVNGVSELNDIKISVYFLRIPIILHGLEPHFGRERYSLSANSKDEAGAQPLMRRLEKNNTQINCKYIPGISSPGNVLIA